jgi:hypothetical protein
MVVESSSHHAIDKHNKLDHSITKFPIDRPNLGRVPEHRSSVHVFGCCRVKLLLLHTQTKLGTPAKR